MLVFVAFALSVLISVGFWAAKSNLLVVGGRKTGAVAFTNQLRHWAGNSGEEAGGLICH